jgi:hypothetical protein
MIVKPEGKRKKCRPSMRWTDSLEKDLRNFGVGNSKNRSTRTEWLDEV